MSKNQNIESNGPDVKVRGTAKQVLDKYLALARDAASAGDRIGAESYFQHAEHYFRIINADRDRQQAQANGQGRGGRRPGEDDQEVVSVADVPMPFDDDGDYGDQDGRNAA